jgi:hypothetical protein
MPRFLSHISYAKASEVVESVPARVRSDCRIAGGGHEPPTEHEAWSMGISALGSRERGNAGSQRNFLPQMIFGLLDLLADRTGLGLKKLLLENAP